MKKYGKGKETEVKKKLTNQEKAELIAKQKFQEIVTQIEEGAMKISSHKKIIEDPKKDEEENPLTLESIDDNLKMLRANIQQQKREQREAEKQKLLKAHELIVKLKKDKEEHKHKIKQNQEKSVLHSRIFSESTIGKMRQKLEERIVTKRKEIQDRIKGIAARQGQREYKSVDQEVSYWQRVKKLSNSQSTKQLPSINPEQEERKKSIASIPRKRSVQNLKTEQPYDKKIDLYIQKAKIRQQHVGSAFKQVQKNNQARLNRLVNSNKLLAMKLGGDRNDRNEFIPIHMNKSKVYGDQYLKDSLLKIKKNLSPNTSDLETDKLSQQDSMELKAHGKYINNNEQIEKLKENWDRMLSRVRHNEIGQQQGLEVLNSLERRLDKINLEGMRDRLKRKCQVLEEKEKQVRGQGQLISVRSSD